MELSFAATDEKLLFVDSSTLDNTYLILKEDVSGKTVELSRIALDDADLDRLVRMLKMVQLQRKEEK
jgi:hypothetical protein